MVQALLISVRFLDGRFHGVGEWPPAPARLFQALICGGARGGTLPEDARAALAWLERLTVPVIAAQKGTRGQHYTMFVPNNDLDSVDGDPRDIGKIRAGKLVHPWLFDAAMPFFYGWLYDADDDQASNANVICNLAGEVYQFGRGVDVAWASGEVIDEPDLTDRLARYQGTLFRPTASGQGTFLDCPAIGSLASLEARFAAGRQRFTFHNEGHKTNVLFSQAPKAHFRSVAYDSPPSRWLFELRSTAADASFAPWPQEHAAALVVQLRDAANQRLADSLPDRAALIERVLIGRSASEADKGSRVRIVPLPSIGHVHADRGIRRVLVEAPTGCEIGAEDIAWAFSGLQVSLSIDVESGEILEETRLVRTIDLNMLDHFGVASDKPNRLWRTVTPAALPGRAARRRIEPGSLREEAKGGEERLQEHGRASTAVLQALRHAGIRAKVASIRLQREAFAAKGARAEAFSPGTRFAKERLWHVEVQFIDPVEGPLIIGDGRYLGLGLMEPVRRATEAFSFSIVDGLALHVNPEEVARALRRAVMSRVQERLDRGARLPAFFCGHTPSGEPLREGNHAHLAFAADLRRSRLLVLAPHLIEARAPTRQERGYLETLDAAIEGLTDLRAGAAGRLLLEPLPVMPDEDRLFAPSQHWESVTDYRPTRHAKRVGPADALVIDVLAEMRRQGRPEPQVEVLEVRDGQRGGFAGRLRLRFKVAQAGPILIGRSRHFGGGLFQSVG
ncbi:type I-U CRISPR-associated protein Csb2 [uncultured Thiodictyon sp.]|uniref:type I-G CRISPR-associated protein Csb2 n=1 Tax=uncultured Thiodictyon sp. TaxID=1846217 RepID=UPI0025F164AF|nr:type I-U CRISPR-associated protein Csb2 [uncultured Thiodictyon sp.]